MSSANEARPLTELLGGLAGDISGLFRKEIQLAKAEANEKVAQTMVGLELIVAGGLLALGALGVLLAALVTALAAMFAARGMGAIGANSLAAAIVGVIVAAIAWFLISRGTKALKSNTMTLDRTAHSLGRDADVVKERL